MSRTVLREHNIPRIRELVHIHPCLKSAASELGVETSSLWYALKRLGIARNKHMPYSKKKIRNRALWFWWGGGKDA